MNAEITLGERVARAMWPGNLMRDGAWGELVRVKGGLSEFIEHPIPDPEHSWEDFGRLLAFGEKRLGYEELEMRVVVGMSRADDLDKARTEIVESVLLALERQAEAILEVVEYEARKSS